MKDSFVLNNFAKYNSDELSNSILHPHQTQKMGKLAYFVGNSGMNMVLLDYNNTMINHSPMAMFHSCPGELIFL